MKYDELNVVEIFTSISGEVGAIPQGSLVQFVRFGGCNLQCPYCDTRNTQDPRSGRMMMIGEILQALSKGPKKVVLTGGEPLIQNNIILTNLIKLLNQQNYQISIETNGTIRIPMELRHYASFVMDYKLDYRELMKDERFLELGRKDWIKFPIAGHLEMVEAIAIQKRLYHRGCVAKFAYSPIFDDSGPFDCAGASQSIIQALKEYQVNATLNLQIHKIIGAE